MSPEEQFRQFSMRRQTNMKEEADNPNCEMDQKTSKSIYTKKDLK